MTANCVDSLPVPAVVGTARNRISDASKLCTEKTLMHIAVSIALPPPTARIPRH